LKEFWRAVFAIVWKDVLSELRTRNTLISVLVFALLVMVIFNFAFDPDPAGTRSVAPGVLWAALSFAGVLSFNRSFVMEKETGCLEGLKSCPVDSKVIYLGKMLASLIFMLIVEIVVLPVFFLFFNLSLFTPQLVLIVVLATIGFVAVGTLFSALTANTRAREVMLPVLFLPVASPVIIAAVRASALALDGEPWGAMASWLGIIAAADVIFLAASSLLFRFVIEE